MATLFKGWRIPDTANDPFVMTHQTYKKSSRTCEKCGVKRRTHKISIYPNTMKNRKNSFKALYITTGKELRIEICDSCAFTIAQDMENIAGLLVKHCQKEPIPGQENEHDGEINIHAAV